MTRSYIISCLLLIAWVALAIYDPSGGTIELRNASNGTARIHFVVNGNTLNYPHNQLFEKIGHREFEILWLSGDTSRSIEITHPGIYVASIKDKHLLNGVWSGPYFLRGLPDTIIIDTIISPNTNYGLPHLDTIVTDIQYTVNLLGSVDTIVESFITRCYNQSCDTIFYRAPRPAFTGFWSGLIDTLRVSRFRQPLRGGGKILTNEDGIVYLLDQWRVSH